jgi:uncharacterized RDD family membrane protein YckC
MQAGQQSPYQTPGHAGPAMVSDYAFAGFWKRFIAYIIDAILFGFLFGVVAVLLGGTIITANPNDAGSVFAVFGFYLFYIPCWWLYFALMESSNAQGTVGKIAMGIKVTNINGQPLGFGHATGRHFAALVTQFTITIGYLLAGFTARKQALHDLIAGTLVVNKRYDAVQIRTASESPGQGMSVGGIIAIIFLVLLIPVGGILAAIAIPAYQDYTMRAKVQQAIIETNSIQLSITEHAANTGFWPKNLQTAGINDDRLNSGDYQILLEAEGTYHIIFKQPEALADNRLIFVPRLNNDGEYVWKCHSRDIEQSYLPKQCRE